MRKNGRPTEDVRYVFGGAFRAFLSYDWGKRRCVTVRWATHGDGSACALGLYHVVLEFESLPNSLVGTSETSALGKH